MARPIDTSLTVGEEFGGNNRIRGLVKVTRGGRFYPYYYVAATVCQFIFDQNQAPKPSYRAPIGAERVGADAFGAH
jgi:hypothetical protein